MEGTWNLNATEEDEYNTELVVHNFHPSLTKQGLRSQFLRFGHVESANVMVNSRGNPVGFVRMRTVGECARAIAGLNGRAPLHWTVKMGAPLAERQRRRREREEAQRFEEEVRPQTEARLREMEQHQRRMIQLTREFRSSLEAEAERPHTPDGPRHQEQNGIAKESESVPDWPALEGLRHCTVCRALTPGYCQNCHAPYCSSECQHADWAVHKHHCRRQPALVVSVGGSDQDSAPVRSVCLGRGDQPRPTPHPAPAPLRRPRTSGDHTGHGPGDPQTSPRPGGPGPQTSPPRPGTGDGPSQPRPQGTSPRRPEQQRASPRAGTSPLQRQTQQKQQKLGAVELRPGQHYSVMVCYAADPSAVNLRLLDQYELVRRMEEDLARLVTPAPAGGLRLEVGQLCAALFEDGGWYRGEVRAISASHHTVHFIDWGNTEDVPLSSVAPLPPALADIPPQAVLAALPWRPAGADGSWSPRQWEGLRALDGQPLTASVVGTEPTVSVALFNGDGKSVLSVMDGGRPELRQETGQTLPEQVQLEFDRKHVVWPCCMRHPQLVCAQLRDAALYRQYQALTAELQTAAEAAPPLGTTPPGDSAALVFCCAAGGPQAWHRAAVQGRHGEQTVVRLLDWGSLHTVEPSQIRQMPPHLAQVPAVGVQFGLHGVPETACDEEELAFYRDKIIGKEFLLERVESPEARVQARLHLLSDTNSFCFNDKMMSRIAARRTGRPGGVPLSVAPVSPSSAASPQKRFRMASDSAPDRPLLLSDLSDPSLQPGDSFPCLLGEVLGAGRFLGSPLTEQNAAAVERLETELREAMSAVPPPPSCRLPLQAGQLVAVCGTGDPEVWNRGAVVECSGPEVLVRLLDVGSQERVPAGRLRGLPREVARLPPTSLLLAFRGFECWSAEQRRLSEKVLHGDGTEEEMVLELTVVAVGAAGAATIVTCPDVNIV